MSKSILTAAMMFLALPAAAGDVAPRFTCQQHIAVIDHWLQSHPEPSGNPHWSRGNATGMRDRAAEACQSGQDREAFLFIGRARQMLGMPEDTQAAVDVAKALEVP